MLESMHASGDTSDEYLRRFAKPSGGDPMADPRDTHDSSPAAATGAEVTYTPIRILSDLGTHLNLFQELTVRGKFPDPKAGGQLKMRSERLIVLKQGSPWSKPTKPPNFAPGEWDESTRFDPAHFTIVAKADGSCMKHIPWVTGINEQCEQLVKFYQHLRKSSLNKATQFSDQEKWSAKLPDGTQISLPHWPETAFHMRRKKSATKGDDDASSMEEPAEGDEPAPKKAKTKKDAPEPVPAAKVAPKKSAPEPVQKKAEPPKPAALQSKGASKPAEADAGAAEKALLTALVFGKGRSPETAYIVKALLEDMHAPCAKVSTNTPWNCTGDFEEKSVADLKTYFETTDEFDSEQAEVIKRDLTSFRKVFKMLFAGVPEGWVPTEQAPPKKRPLCLD